MKTELQKGKIKGKNGFLGGKKKTQRGGERNLPKLKYIQCRPSSL
jgi:hypothetical protein